MPPYDTMKRIVEFYRDFEPNYVEGERVIVTKPINRTGDNPDTPVGTVCRICIRWYGTVFNYPANCFFIGVDFGGGHQQYGLGLWDKIESLDNPPVKQLIRNRYEIQIPRRIENEQDSN